MKTGSFYSHLIRQGRRVSVALGLFACAFAVSGAEKTNPPAPSGHVATNAAAKLPAIVIPTSQFAEGRNPFFPESASQKFAQSSPSNNTARVTSVPLELKGISGTGTKRYALINGRTFEEGEEGDVTVNRSKVHVRCLKIREDGVTIEVDGDKRELKLRPGL